MGKLNTNSLAKPGASQSRNVAAVTALTGGKDSGGKLDRLIHERTRLAIVSALATSRSLSFTDLKSQLSVSDGNLSTHARKLEEAGYIRCKKQFKDRVPRTDYALTAAGRKALDNYITHMEALIQSVKRI